MKSRLFLVLAFCLFSIQLFAQAENHKGKRLSVGLSVGPAIDWISPNIDEYDGVGPIVGLRYGIPVDINLTHESNYYFSTGILFQHTGGKLSFPSRFLPDLDSLDVSIQRKYSSIFLAIPTGIKLKTPSFNNFVFAGNFGLLHGFKLNSKKQDKYEVNGLDHKDNKKSEFEGASFFKESIYVGIGLEYIIKDDFRASFFFNYSYSFTNYFNKKAVATDKRIKGNHNGIEFVFGIFF